MSKRNKHGHRHRKADPWTPLKPAQHGEISREHVEHAAKTFNLTVEEVMATFEDVTNDQVFLNNRYQVNVRLARVAEGWPEMVHLSIKRIDKERIGRERYRDFMRIKDELVGPESEAVELYPARTREVDTANQYHVWVMRDSKLRFPFGFDPGKRVASGADNAKLSGAKQADFDDHHNFEDRK